MKVTEQAIGLIKACEGFRPQAYHDATGILTIGYGHTSMAGAPMVQAHSTVTTRQAEEILKADVEAFAAGLRQLLRRELSDQQFSALVSFTYNVGLENAAQSSVLTAVNAGDFEAVPRRLALWVKAGGRTLPGLVKRRAAEAAMFVGGNDVAQKPQVPAPKPAYCSRTLWSAAAIVMSALVQAAAVAAPMVARLLAVALITAAAIIIYERFKKLKQENL